MDTRFRSRVLTILRLSLVAGPLACAGGVELDQAAWQGEFTGGPAAISGSVAAVSVNGRTQASIHIDRATPGDTYAWRLAGGSCQAEGALVGGAAAYPPLTASSSGSADADAVLSQGLGSGPYAARVLHQPAGAVVACTALARIH